MGSVLGTGVLSAVLGKGQMEGRRRCFRQRGLHWLSASSAQSQLSSQRWQGLVSSSGGQQGPSLPLSACGTVPDTRPLGKQEHRADLISLWYLAVPTPLPVLPICCCPVSYHDLSAIGPVAVDVGPHPGRRVACWGVSLPQRCLCLCQTFP